jgi:hypothetical protein
MGLSNKQKSKTCFSADGFFRKRKTRDSDEKRMTRSQKKKKEQEMEFNQAR